MTDRIIDALIAKYPAAFTANAASVQPLPVGIFADLRQELGDAFTVKQLSAALRKYTGSSEVAPRGFCLPPCGSGEWPRGAQGGVSACRARKRLW
jgi:RNA chaperone ProQ/FINO-like protein